MMNASTRQFSLHDYWKPLALTAAIAFLYHTTLTKLARDWWDDPNYSHGLLVPLIIAYILWTERERLARIPPRPALWTGFGLIACGVAGVWAGIAGAELFVQRTSLVMLLMGLALFFFGWRHLRAIAVPLLLLVLAIPIPSIVFNKIAFPLQLFASRCAVSAMRGMDIPVLRDGNVIELMPLGATIPKKLEVVEACSGIRSLMTLLTLAVVFAYFTYNHVPTRRNGKTVDGENLDDATLDNARDNDGRWFAWLTDFRFWRACLLVLAAFPIAILTNALRVSGTGVLAHYYGTEIADGFFHSFSGWIIYVIAFLLLFATAWLLDTSVKLLLPRNKREVATNEHE